MSTYNTQLGDWAALKKTLSHPLQAWESGAKELEKTSIGKIITAPIRLTEKAVDSAGNVIEDIPKLTSSIPVILIILAVGIGGYLVYSGKKGTKFF